MVGETISHYRVLDKLGQGGMGDVYSAEDVKLGRTGIFERAPRDAKSGAGRIDRTLRHDQGWAILPIEDPPSG